MAINDALKNMSTNHKVILSSAIPLIFLFILSLATYYFVNSLDKTNRLVNNTYGALGDAEDIIANAVDMETGMRGYLLSGKESFLEPYQSGSEQVFSAIRDLQEASTDQAQIDRLEDAYTVLSQWQADVAEVLIELRRDIGNSADLLDLAALVAENKGEVYFEAFEEEAESFVATAQANGAYSNTIAIYKLEINIWHMLTSMRGYLLSGNLENLEHYDENEQDFYENLAKLKDKVIGKNQQLQRLIKAGNYVTQWRDTIAVPFIEIRKEIGTTKNLKDLGALVAEERGKFFFGQFRQAMADFQAAEQQLFTVRTANNDNTVKLTFGTIVIGSILALVMGGMLSFSIGHMISRPIRGMTTAMSSMAEGNLNVHVPGADNQDEIGKMALAMETFRENTLKAHELEKEREITDTEKREQSEKLVEMTGEFNQNISSLIETLGSSTHDLQSTAYRLNDVASTASEQSSTLNEAAESSSNSVSSVASTSEQLSASIREINQQASRAAHVSQTAMERANIAQKGMSQLEKSSEKIGDIVSLIQDIAEQTNLLALNATIEAARAGDAGKGFAVVAHEVKSLASQTAKATSEISQQISDTQDATHQSVDIIRDVVGIINEMNDIASIISSAVEEQSSSMEEIVNNAHSATTSAKQVYLSVDTVRNAANDTDEASRSMGEVAKNINDSTVNLQREIKHFIQGVSGLGFNTEAFGKVSVDKDYQKHLEAAADRKMQEITSEEVDWRAKASQAEDIVTTKHLDIDLSASNDGANTLDNGTLEDSESSNDKA